MPKNEVDYSNTIIYKIYCKDEAIKDIYVGHTTNFIKRKCQHKTLCNNSDNKLKIYDVIRNNGGWGNWEMIEIAKYNCKDSTEARIKEQYHYEDLKASLNSSLPYVDKTKYFCIQCNLTCSGPKQYNEHIASNKHIKLNKTSTYSSDNAGNEKNAKKSNLFVCELCNFNCCKKSNFLTHIKTKKHNDNKMVKNGNYLPKNADHVCKCGNIYKHLSGLSRHKKTCNFTDETAHQQQMRSITPSNIITTELVLELIKDNKEMKQIILEQHNTIHSLVKNGTNQITNSLNNNNNKTFNLQFFLNETCKDAMNIMDFVDSIKLQLTDLEKVGELGYTQGISNIITTNLKALDVTQRPVHCTDKKRETMYIKDENKWEKEDEHNTKLKKMIRHIENKNIKLLPLFREKYPEYKNSSSKMSDKYDKMVLEAMGGAADNGADKQDKIIHNISKCVVIDKYINEN